MRGDRSMTARLVEVALPLPLFRTFTYAVEIEPAHPLTLGSRIVVPLRKGREIGIAVGFPEESASKVVPKAIFDVPDPEPAIDANMLALCRWIAEYYIVPLGVVIRSALPVLLAGASVPTPSQKTRRIVSLRSDLPSLMERDKAFARSKRQRELFELLESLGGRSPVDHLLEHLRFSASVLKGLEQRGFVSIEAEVVGRDPFARRPPVKAMPHALTGKQRLAVDALKAGKGGDTFLLHGVTGSGKTQVYIELLREVVERRGQSAIVLVPEIALTPQTVDRFRAVFGDLVAVLHSGLSDGERYDAWLALRRGEKRIAVGARSAIFAPLANVGAIIVDEEHEGSYKQGETPRYHAREVAIVRARNEGAVLVLGSATPSLESWTNATSGKYTLLTLPDRVAGGRLPDIEIVDLRQLTKRMTAARELHAGGPPSIFGSVFSPELEDALAVRLELKEQSIILLNRRGYAAFVQCGACGDVAVCPNCSITLTYHKAPERLICHYCLHEEPPRTECHRCGGVTLRQRGLGTQQVERLLAERFASARIARMDVDTTSGKWAHAEILDRVGRDEVDILLGTQMIAKGLDFPNVTLVGVIDADVGVNFPDFRASERSFQLLSQVSGRAGRGPKGGRVLIQTRLPEHHAVRCAVAHDFLGFVREELPSRIQPPYPPTIRLANVIFSGTFEGSTAKLALAGAEWLHGLLRARDESGITIVGPAPCPIERIKQRWRWHLMLKAESPGVLTRVSRYFVQKFEVPKKDGLRMVLDRDPVALL
jgi:primosomal protein N' (replication factor Y)